MVKDINSISFCVVTDWLQLFLLFCISIDWGQGYVFRYSCYDTIGWKNEMTKYNNNIYQSDLL